MSQPPCKILVVDDNPEDRELYRRFLQKDEAFFCTLLEASTGQEGLTLWQQHYPDGILLDYRLPDMDGLEFLAELRAANPQLPALPVVMLTGLGNEAIAVKAIKAGAQDYLVKGQITAEMLQLAVQGAIESVRLHTELHQRIEREHLITQITRKIHGSLDLDEILDTTVMEVRRFLQTDRVLIYRLQENGFGTITCESVGGQWTPLLSTSYQDDCFNTEYIEKFRQGLVTVKADIYDGTINPCHVELLANLQVRANLVVPILQGSELWGMLIAHHCEAPRHWKTLEIDLLKELANQVGIALQRAELYQQAQYELAERRRATAALRVSEERFRQLAENIDAAFWIRDLQDDEVVYVSPAYERLWGLDPKDLFSNKQAWPDRLHPDDREAVNRAFCEKAIAGLFDEEYRIILANGAVRWVRDRCFPLKDETGTVYRLTGLAEDITERKQTELALQESQTQLQEQLAEIEAIYQSVPIGLNVMDTDLRFRRINQRLAEINGLPVEAHLGRTIRDILPEMADAAEALLRPMLESGEPLFDVEIQGETPAQPGVRRTWLEHFLPLRNGDRIIGISTVCEEITQRKQAEQERERLLRQEQAARQEAEHANRIKDEFLAVLSHELRTPLNPILGWVRILQTRELDEVKTREALATIERNARLQAQLVEDLLDISRIMRGKLKLNVAPVDLLTIVSAALETVRLSTEAKSIHLQLALPDASASSPDSHSSRQSQTSHEPPTFQVLGDATRLQQVVWNLLSNAVKFTPQGGRVEVRLGVVDEWMSGRVDEWMSGSAPLTHPPIHPIPELVEESTLQQAQGSAPSPIHPVPELVEGSTLRQAQGSAHLPIHPVPELVEESTLQQAQGSAPSPIHPSTHPPIHPIPELVEGSPLLYAQITITDTGKGIQPDFLPHIFDYFRQEDSSTTRKFGGLGLGLAIARQIVEMHGGTIRATSQGEGQGASFTVNLPLLDSAALLQHKGAVAALTESQDEERPLEGLHVLVVDDEADTRSLLIFLLEQRGARVTSAESAGTALQLLKQKMPDIILSDIGMAEMNGYEFMQIVRQRSRERGGRVPAIALTAYAAELDQHRAIAAGFQRHMSKPIDLEQLVGLIMELTHR